MFNLKSLAIAGVTLGSLFMVGCSSGTPTANNPVDQAAVQVSGYVPYSASAVNLAVSQGKKTAVFFHGASCGSCAKLDANIKANVAKIPSDVVVFNADWDDNQDLAVKYGAPKYHTVTYLNADGSVAKNVGGLFELDKLVGEFAAPQAAAPAAKVATNYVPYSESAVKLAASEGKKTAVFFHGASCGSCAKLDANIKANVAKIPSDVVVFNADWDDNQDLAAEYGVAKYHTVSYLNTDGSLAKNVTGLFETEKLLGEFDKPNAANNYVPYSESAVKLAASEGKKTAVFFHGASCGSCAKLDANIKANVAKIPSDVVVFNADWDDNQDLAAEYGVAKYHTVSYLNTDGSLAKNVTGLFETEKLLGEFSS